jgi:hypothetical protein
MIPGECRGPVLPLFWIPAFAGKLEGLLFRSPSPCLP